MKKFTSYLLQFSTAALLACACLTSYAQSFGFEETFRNGMQGVRAEQATKAFDMAYVDLNLLKKAGLANEEPDEDMIDWKVPELARWFQERFSKVLAANGLEGEAISAQESKRPVLVVTPVKYTKRKPRLFATAGTIYFELQWIDPVNGRPQNFGELQVFGGLGFDPVLGILKTNRVNAAWADGVLMAALTALAKKGLVELPEGKAVKPRE